MSGFQRVCALDDIAPGSAKRIMVDGIAVAVVRTDDGVFAINDRCSHADVSLADGEVDGCTIECWLHGSAFDLRSGEPLSLPAIVPVPVYAARVIGEGADAAIEVDPTPVTTTTRTEDPA